MKTEEAKFWLALKRIEHLSNRDIITLINLLATPDRVFNIDQGKLKEILPHNPRAAEEIAGFHKWAEVEREMEKLTSSGAKIVTFLEPDYPELLKNIHDYPVFLYVKGTLSQEDVNIAIVGSRRASSYGIITAENLARSLTYSGFTIVSGMARGIDAAAHQGALSARGRTIAVLGSGLDFIYPPENHRLYESITQSGAVVTEFPFGTPPRSKNFPIRNRLISGMAWGVVVVEASEKSGSLITARLAAEQGRAVFAVPGEINSPLSRGTHRLLKEGATLIESARDIVEELMPQVRPKKREPEKQDSDLESVLLQFIREKPVQVEDLILQTGLPAGEVMGRLLLLELKGLIQQLPGKYYKRI